jgi:hypothetical protein
MMFTLICSPFGGGRRAEGPLGLGKHPGRIVKFVLPQSPLRQTSKH